MNEKSEERRFSKSRVEAALTKFEPGGEVRAVRLPGRVSAGVVVRPWGAS